ncbi:MAG: tRNA uridine-5-carboxymethylaminomethyl(34) synthesis GTPase MnmE [Gemmatimonadaceae bacterium]|nr:tRNA uridine-5-carboxymethylaminomethyl(34) synthesis GTPase MnmE [Gemmatimonadaceae bacterium]
MTSALLPGGDDTIVAEATAAGRGAIAVIRLSGARATDVARALGASALTPRRATRVRLVHPTSGEPLDDALVTWFAAPHSYTGEDVVELATHGGRVAPARVLAACVAAGARIAYAGEFTRRAVVHGKLDLLQAEAVADLIDARTSALQRVALAQLDGGLSRRLLALREAVLELEALLAYDVDFPEEDDGPIDRTRIADAATGLRTQLSALLRTAPTGAMLRDGALVVLAGAPNAGKSSLFNALLGDARAIVTPIAGTTRDAIEAVLDRAPVPLRLVDTAGLRETTDTLEQLGIEVSARYLAQAQVVLACGASADEVAKTQQAVAPLTAGVVLPVLTKADLHPALAADPTAVSAETGEGLAALLARIDAALAQAAPAETDAVLITRERHRLGLTAALDEIQAFEAAWSDGALPATVVAVHLYAARTALEELIGSVDVEDVLGRVFASFCIGK